jgi:hypothetical protein
MRVGLRSWTPVPAMLLVLLACSGAGGLVMAHEIEEEVRIRIYLKPETNSLTALIRVPLIAMRDFDFASRASGAIDLERIDAQLIDAVSLWLLNDLSLYESGRKLAPPAIEALRVALPSDRSFDDFITARSSIRQARLTPDTELYAEHALLDVALVYQIEDERSEFTLQPTLGRLGIRTLTQIRYLTPGGDVRGISFTGDPGRVSLDPGFPEVFGQFLQVGFGHVLEGIDHLLFVLVLVIPLVRIRVLVAVITAFAIAQSITLAAALFDLVPTGLWFPPLIEVLIAASIFYLAIENMLQPSIRRRWVVAFGFGLVHGFGFSFVLRETVQFAGDHLLTSLLAFNIGIELGQLLVVIVAVPILKRLYQQMQKASKGFFSPVGGTEEGAVGGGVREPYRPLMILLSAVIAHSAWHWLVERWELFSQYRPELPAADLVLVLGVIRWLLLILTATLVAWLLRGPLERWARL